MIDHIALMYNTDEHFHITVPINRVVRDLSDSELLEYIYKEINIRCALRDYPGHNLIYDEQTRSDESTVHNKMIIRHDKVLEILPHAQDTDYVHSNGWCN